MGTYSIDSITRYINFYEIITRRNAKYPFVIFNTDKENGSGVHWLSFMDIHPKNNLFLFDPFGVEGFQLFIVDNDQKIINELLYNFKKCESKSSQKSKLCTMNVFYKNLFDSDEKSKILSHQTLNKSTLETNINEIFSTDVDENEHIIKNFKEVFEL